MTKRLTVQAPAKVNLVLQVLGKRTDGYHDVRTVLQSVDLCDEVSVELGGTEIELDVDGPDLGPLDANLAYRAASAFRAAAGFVGGVRITLKKGIPAGAGLGGGSSDAAAVLACLSDLTGATGRDELHALAADLGSDVPFFLGSGTLAVGTGRGDVLEALPPLPEGHLVVVLTPVQVSTTGAYAALAEARGRALEPPAPVETSARSWDDVRSAACNDFEEVVASMHPEIERALGALSDAGAAFALLAGSGGACFGFFDDRDQAVRVATDLSEELGWSCVPVRTLVERPLPAARP